MVIMDRQDYINKANSLLNQNTYRSIHRDPTNSIKNKLISILKRVKNQTWLDSNTYKSMYPTGCAPKVQWPSQDPQTRHSPKAYSVYLWICHLWCGQGTCQNPKTIGWQVPTPHKHYPRLCGTGQTHHLGTWRMSQFL